MFIRPWLEALKSHWMPGNRLTKRRASEDKPVQSQVEALEDRALLAAFDLVTVIPNQGVFLSDGAKLNEAPKEVTLRFSPGQTITQASLGAITVIRAGVDGIFDNPATPALESTDDVGVSTGYVGLGELPNEVIVRFAQTLVDDRYQVRIQATGPAAIASVTGDAFNNGVNKAFNFELDLGARVEAVVPQPVFRSAVFSTTGLGNLTDGDIVTITAGANTYRFEMNLLPNNVTSSGNIRVDIPVGSNATQIATALVTAINANTGGELTASNGGGTTNTLTVVGAAFEPVVAFSTTRIDAFAKAFLTIPNGAAVLDTDFVTITLNNVNYSFEFNRAPSNSVTIGRVRVDLAPADTAVQVATKLAAAINALPLNNPTQQLRATVVGNSIALTALPALGTPSIVTSTLNAGALTQVFGTLSQATDKVVVYFNQDQLSNTSANDPKFYKLINSTTGFITLPSSVTYTYNNQNGLSVAVLTFPAALGDATYSLKVGTSTEPNDTTATAVQAGSIFSTKSFTTSNYLGDGSGTSSNTADVDLYQFSLTAAGTATLTLESSATLNGVITLLDSNGVIIAGPLDGMGAGLTEVLASGALPAGTYYARVTSNASTGGYKLTIQSNVVSSASDDNSSFGTSTDLGALGTSGLSVTAQIEAQGAFVLMPQLPGGSNEPGHRELPSGAFTGFSAPEVGHGTGTTGGPSAPGSTGQITYSFPVTYGPGLQNQITTEQKEIIRQIFTIYANQVGLQFREVAAGGMGIVVGDIRVNAPTLAADQVGGISGNPLIINSIFYQNDNTFGGGFTGVAFHEIGHNLGLGHSYDVPSIQGSGGNQEQVYAGDNDIIHLLRVAPDNSSDIDLYQFNVNQAGTLSAQTVAERLGVTNLLDSVLTLYKEDGSGNRTVISRNDDFFSKDSGLEIAVTPGKYYIGVTSTGNDNYDPSISNSGNGGRSRGTYQLKLDFKPSSAASSGLVDTTGQFLDGDHNGKAGGEYVTSFTVAPTRFVDKLALTAGTGTLADPYKTISAALAAAAPGEIVRIVGNGGADGDASTLVDNVPYTIGLDYSTAAPLADGQTFQVPKDVTVVIDAGALLKIRGQTIDVGTSSAGIDRSHGVLQVLGTPVNNVTFTSWRDDAKGSIDDATNGNPAGADWGGLVFRQDSDHDNSAILNDADKLYLNTVNHATIQYGGGQVSVDGGGLRVYNAIDIETSRPTISNNRILNNADSAISANPDSFKADDLRIGPDIYGNIVTQNSTNGLFIRIQTPLGSGFESLNVIARFDDTDITHVIAQNLILNGKPAGSLLNPVSARLMIDPGTIVKLSGARIETGTGRSNLIAEGTAQDPIRFTSQQDDRYGTGGTFDLKNDGATVPSSGNWSGIFVAQGSHASLDHVSVAYAGGLSEIAGNSDNFNPVEVLQGYLRVTNSLFENNLGGQAGTVRGGRGGNDSSTIFVRGAQPVLVNNVFRNNVGNVVSINANSMQSVVLPDYGRSTGNVDSFTQFDDNYGPLVRLNKFANSATFAGSSTLGMNIRPEELTIESVWDDTDIAHVVRGTITSSEFHTYGGLRLQSSATGSLVVKLQGATAGFVATGDPLEISDRIGGTVQIVGQPGFPVILTSLRDDTISAGFKPNGFPQFDTNGDNNAGGASAGVPGDWNSISFDRYSNDRNVSIVLETEPSLTHSNEVNATVGNPQALGELAPNQNSGDENRRLGYEVHGFISPDAPGDVDVYSFNAKPGTEVWIDTDFTSQRLDVMVELLNSAGVVLARSLNSQDEASGLYSLTGTLLNTIDGVAQSVAGNSDLNTLTKDPTLGVDFYTSNFHDAGFRAVLPGTGTNSITYFVRVRSQPVAGQETAAIPVGGNGLTSGAYQLQVRLKQVDEIPGSTVRYADIRYATNGIVLTGLPAHSPIMGEAAEATNDNNNPLAGQYLGPLLQTDRNTFSVAGSLQSESDVDFFSFTVDYSQVQVVIPGPKFFPTTFDIDWADGMTRPDTVIAVYNSNRDLIYIGRESDISDDQQNNGVGSPLADLSRGSLGKLDAFIGTVNLPAGVAGVSETGGVIPGPPPGGLQTYYVAVFSNGQLPTALSAGFRSNASPETQRVRLEPINSIKRVVEDHIGFTGYSSQGSNIAPTTGPMFNTADSISLQTNIRPFTLSDVNLFVTNSSSLFVVDPFNGTTEIDYANYGNQTYQDIDMRSDGRLYAVRSSPGAPQAGALVELDTGTGGELSAFSDGITDVDGDPATQRFQNNNSASTALAFRKSGAGASYDIVFYATADNDDYPSNIGGVSKLYRASAASGSAAWVANNLGASGIVTDAGGTITTLTTGLQMFGGQLWGVSAGNQLYPISQQNSINGDGGTNVGNPDSANPAVNAALTPRLVNGAVLNYAGVIPGGSGTFAGITDAPQNVENSAYADLLFIITSTGRIFAVDPTAGSAAASLQMIFDTDNDNIADSNFIDTNVTNPTGLAFSPVDFNLWHPTERRANDLGHGVNTTSGLAANPSVDNSRVPGDELITTPFGSESLDSTEGSGGASLYFGLEEYNPGAGNNYYQYDSGGQYGVLSSASHQDIAANANIGNNYNVPGGTSGSLVTNSFSLEGYTATDKPTLYFNYNLATEGASGKTANSMRDSARVYISVDNGLTWDLAATNNSTPSADDMADAELPAFYSASKSASPKPNQHVQELFDTNTWRQARIDLQNYVGNTQIKLRFDFSTSGRSGTVTDPLTGLSVPSDDTSNPTFVNSEGSSNGVTFGGSNSPLVAQNNTAEGFYIDDIIVGFAGRGEMVTASTGQGSTFIATPEDPDPMATPPLLTGQYQLEIRRGEQYGALVDPPTPDGYVGIFPTLDINDRQSNGETIMVGNSVQDGTTIEIYDGIITRTFEFNSVGGVTAGNIAVSIGGSQGANASALASAINTAFNGRKTVTARAVGPAVNSDRVDVFGAISVTAPIVTAGGPTLGAQVENNDTLATATVSGITAAFNGRLSGTGQIGNGANGDRDVDFYSMVLSAGQRVSFETDLAAGGDSYLRVFNAAGTQLASSDDDQGPNPELSGLESFLVFIAPAAGTYYVGVSGYNNSAYDPNVAGSGVSASTFTYTLTAALVLGNESESSFLGYGNDYPVGGGFPTQVANVINPFSAGTNNTYQITGAIGNSQQGNDDSDFFQVTMVAGQTLTVELIDTDGNFSNFFLGVTDGSLPPLATAIDGILTFTATANGTYFLGVFGDDGNPLTSPVNLAFGAAGDPLATPGNDTFNYLLDISLTPAGFVPVIPLTVDSFVRQGDDNLERTQGQIIIENNTILHASNDGIQIDDDDRFGTTPHPGAPMNTPVNNTQALVTGIYIQNNVIARFGRNGIDITGDTNANLGRAITPFVKIVNNTIYGNDGSTIPGSGLADVIFMIDVSGSMGGNIATLVSQILTFDTAFQAANITARYGLVEFPTAGFPGNPMQTQDLVDFATFTAPAGAFLNITTTGGTEDGAVAISESLNNFDPSTTFTFTPNAKKVLVMLTNEDDDSTVAQQAQAAVDIAANSAVFFAIADAGFGTTVQDYGPLAAASGGALLDLSQFQTNTAVFFQAFIAAVTGSIQVGGASGVGINVRNSASPTIMNNILANLTTGLQIDASSSSTEIEANLYQGNTTDGPLGNNALAGADTAGLPLFVNAAANNFYPAPTSPIVDSSRKTFNDRGAYVAVTNGLGIPASPIIAPSYDRFGQLRVDDLNSPGPINQPGLGSDPFQDRGAIERADFDGGTVIPVGPQDNDGAGIDLDGTTSTIWIDSANPVGPFNILTELKLQLIDAGIGIDDISVGAGDFLLLQNGTPLTESLDYFFTYNQNTNEAIFTSVATFTLDSRYQIVINAAGITDLAGNPLQNNQPQVITPANPQITAPFDSSLLYFTYIVTDGDNDGPVTSLGGVPAPTTPATAPPVVINEDSSVTFSTTLPGPGAITVDDQDAFLAPDGDPNTGSLGGRIRVTVSIPAGFGSLALAANSTVDLLANGGGILATGVPIDQIVLDGRIDDINTALNGLRFTPLADFPIGLPAATVNITVLTEDLGKFGPPAPGNTLPQATTTIIPVVINPVNDQPTFSVTTPTPITILEDKVTPTQIDLTNILAGGGENQTLQITATSSNTGLVPNANISVNYTSAQTTGNVQFLADPDRFGTTIITITVTDAGLDGIFGINPGTLVNDDGTFSRNITVNVTGVNDAPTIATPPNATVLEDVVTQTVNLSGIGLGAFEFPGQTLTLTATSSDPAIIPDPTIVYVQGAATALLTYRPAANRNGTVTITITAMDDGGVTNGGDDTTTTSFTVTVVAVNDAPTVTVPANLTINEDAVNNPQQLFLTGVSAGPFEPGQNITNISVTSSDQSIIPNANIVQGALSGGTVPLTITPLADQFGLVTITVTITDDGANGGVNGDVNTITRTFTINILPVNDTPSFDVVPPQNILEDAPQQTITLTNISAGPSNESSQILTLTATSMNTALIANPIIVGSIIGGQATLQYTPIANTNGTVIIRVTLRDNGGVANGAIDTYTQDIVINITAVNDAPTLNAIPNQPLSGLLLEDAAQQTVNLSGISAGPPNESTQTLTVTASITSGNPNLVNNFIGSAVAANGTATLRYTPVANEFGTAVVTVRVEDNGTNGGGNGDVNFTTRTFTITITPVNDAPTMTVIPDQVFDEDVGQQSIPLAGISVGPANEAPPQTLSFTLSSDNPALIPNDSGHLSIVYSQGNPTGQLLFTSVPNGYGVANITLTIRDTGGLVNGGFDTLVRTFKITVNQVQDNPTNINLVGNTVFENRPIGTGVGTLSTTDVDLPDDSFTYSIIGGTGVGFFQIAGSQLQTAQVLDFEPPASNSYSLLIRTTDRFGLFFDKTFNVAVQNLNDAPTLNPISPLVMNEDPLNPVIVNLSGISAGFGEAQTLTVTASSDNSDLFNSILPVNYTSPNATGTLSLLPKLNANGTATITVTVTDNGGTANGGINTITRTFLVTVNPINDNPTDINLSNDTIQEVVAGTPLPTSVPVGQLSSVDPDNPGAGDTFAYTLVGGVGSTDNTKFTIINDQLFAIGAIDFDLQPDYTIRVRTTDNGSPNLSFEKVLTIHSTNINEPATGIGTAANPISNVPNSIPENLPPNSIVGALVAADPDAGDVTTFTLVSGVGATDNALFKIVGPNLVANITFNFEVKNSYTVRLRAVDSQGLVFETPVTINVTNVNETPIQLNLSNNTVPENITVGTNVGTLTTLDVDNPENFTYTLVPGTGSADNARFAINGDKLVVATPLNYEERLSHSYAVRVRSTDIGGLTIERELTVFVTDVNDAPTNLTLSSTSINENLPAGSLVGLLTPIDEDSPEFYTYEFIDAVGTDNGAFQLNGNRLEAKGMFDFESKSNYTVRVRGTDLGGHQIERQFTITINDTKDGPVIALADSALTTTGRKGVLVDTGATITDIDSPNFNGGKLVVKVQAGEQTGDTLSILKEKGSRAISLRTARGKTVLRLGTQDIATIKGGVRGEPLEIQFGSGISQDLFQRVMRRISFKGKPFAAPRQISMQAFDELGIASNIEIRNINVN